jgi:Right handed beta helix region
MYKIFRSLLLGLLVFAPLSAYSTKYYLDNVNGLDSNVGSEAAPWETMQAIQDKDSGSGFALGDELRFKAGGKWHPGMEIENPDTTIGYVFEVPAEITKVDSYSTGTKPEIWGTVSLDDGYSISWGSVKSYEWENGHPWSLYSGEIYKKSISRCPNSIFQDTTKLNPVYVDTDASSFSLKRGEWIYISPYHTNFASADRDKIFVCTTTGASPDNFAMECSALNLRDTAKGLVSINGNSDLTVSNLRIMGAFWRGAECAGSGIALTGTNSNITVKFCEFRYSMTGLFFVGDNDDCTISDSKFIYNYGRGVGVMGTSNKIVIQNNDFYANGRIQYYNSAAGLKWGDCDGIGIGQSYCDIDTIYIEDCKIEKSGPTDNTSSKVSGSGIYLGTYNPCTVGNLYIRRNFISQSHGHGIHISRDDCSGGIIDNNIVTKNASVNLNSAVSGAEYIYGIAPGKCEVLFNTIWGNYSQKYGLYVNENINVSNNIIGNNDSFYSTYNFIEVNLQTLNYSKTFDYNCIWNSDSSIKAIYSKDEDKSYLPSARDDFETDTGLSSNGIWGNPLLTDNDIDDVSDADLSSTSPLLDQGLYISYRTLDNLKNSRSNPPDIGALEQQ